MQKIGLVSNPPTNMPAKKPKNLTEILFFSLTVQINTYHITHSIKVTNQYTVNYAFSVYSISEILVVVLVQRHTWISFISSWCLASDLRSLTLSSWIKINGQMHVRVNALHSIALMVLEAAGLNLWTFGLTNYWPV